MSDYIVIRRAPDLPEDFYIGDLEGKWFDRGRLDQLPINPPRTWALIPGPQGVAVPTGRFEVRGDGVVAEVYEVRP